MKKYIKLIITIILILPIFVDAFTYEKGKEFAEDYQSTLSDYKIFLKEDSGGFISKEEYELASRNNLSYLFNSEEFWTSTKIGNSNSYYIVTGNGISELNESEDANIKIVKEVKSDVVVSGTGTNRNPWEFVPRYNLKVKTNNAEYGTLGTKTEINAVVLKGEDKSIDLTPKRGYAYKYNTCGDTLLSDDKKSLLINNINSDLECTINFDLATYLIKISSENKLKEAEPSTMYLKYNTKWYKDSNNTIELEKNEDNNDILTSLPTRIGYTFNGCYTEKNGKGTQIIDSNGVIDSATEASQHIYSNSNIYTNWKANKYTVTLNGNGATTAGTASVTATYDSAMPSIIVPQRKYNVTLNYNGNGASNKTLTATYTFNGYYYNSTKYYNGNGQSARTWNVASNATLTANWTAGNVTLDSPTRPGYTFVGWYTSASGGTKVGNGGAKYTPTKNITLYARWKVNTYTITLDGNGATTAGTTSVTATYDSAMPSITVPQRKYNVTLNYNGNGASNKTLTATYTFNGYYYNSTKYYNGNGQSARMWNVASNATLTANWTAGNVTLDSPTRPGYTFAGWYTSASGGTKVGSAGAKYTPTKNITLYAHWTANEYTINYYLGNGTSTGGTTKIGSSTCTYNSSCTLTSFSNLGGIFPYSSADKTENGKTNYGWYFVGWSTTQTGTNRAYSNSKTFTYNTIGDINLYAVGAKWFGFYSGVNPTTYISSQYQYWNPYSTSTDYMTSISIPNQTDINTWEFIGYRGGSSSASSTVTYDISKVGTTIKPVYSAWGTNRSVYKRTLTLKYNANGGSGTVANQTATQYYNSGYGSSGSNVGGNVSTSTFYLRKNNFSKTGYYFSKWAAGSSSGTQYAAQTSYSGFSPSVSSTTLTRTMYAIWSPYYVTVNFKHIDGTLTTPTSYNGNTFNWTTKSNYLYVNNYLTAYYLKYGESLSSDGLLNYNNKYYLNITRPGYTGKSGAEWKCLSGNCNNSTYSQYTAYSSSDFCDNSTSHCTVTLGVNWTANTYTINYYLGNGTSTGGTTKIGSSTCTYGKSCTLSSFTSFEKTFPGNTYGWSFYGWSTTQTGTSRAYKDSATFTYNTAGNINLYAIGEKTFRFYSGISPETSNYNYTTQYWNPYSTSTSYLTSITVPTATSISGWTFKGYKAGSSEANGTVTFSSTGSSTPTYNVWPYNRAIYSRTLTIKYNANGGSGTVSNQTATQYYNSGYQGAGTISSVTFTLSSNAFTKSGYTFTKWTEGSTSGTEYSAGVSYTFAPGVSSSASKTMYAKWSVINKTIRIYYHMNGGSYYGTSSLTSKDNFIACNGYSGNCDENGYYYDEIKEGESADLSNFNNSSWINITKSYYHARGATAWYLYKQNNLSNSKVILSHSTKYSYDELKGYAQDMGDYYKIIAYVNWKSKYYCYLKRGYCTISLKSSSGTVQTSVPVYRSTYDGCGHGYYEGYDGLYFIKDNGTYWYIGDSYPSYAGWTWTSSSNLSSCSSVQ